MTEEEWLAYVDPVPMLEFVVSRASDRKLRLFLCACCARVVESAHRRGLTRRGQPECMRMIESALGTVERFADGFGGTTDLEAARQSAAEGVYVPAYIDYGGESHLDDESLVVQGAASRELTLEVVVSTCHRALIALRKHPGMTQTSGGSLEPLAEPQMAGWLRDAVGNPLRPVAFNPEWRTSTALALAQQTYDRREFSAMPILADALQDAGCDNDDILNHCRADGPHIRGCWVVDAILGKG